MGKCAVRFSPHSKFSIEAFVRSAQKQSRLSSRDIDDSRIPEGGTAGWTTFNIRNSWELSPHFKFNFIFENVFNEAYKEHGSGVYSPGRSSVVGIRFQY